MEEHPNSDNILNKRSTVITTPHLTFDSSPESQISSISTSQPSSPQLHSLTVDSSPENPFGSTKKEVVSRSLSSLSDHTNFTRVSEGGRVELGSERAQKDVRSYDHEEKMVGGKFDLGGGYGKIEAKSGGGGGELRRGDDGGFGDGVVGGGEVEAKRRGGVGGGNGKMEAIGGGDGEARSGVDGGKVEGRRSGDGGGGKVEAKSGGDEARIGVDGEAKSGDGEVRIGVDGVVGGGNVEARRSGGGNGKVEEISGGGRKVEAIRGGGGKVEAVSGGKVETISGGGGGGGGGKVEAIRGGGGGGGKGGRFRPIMRRGKREKMVKMVALGFRVVGAICCLISFSVMAADKNKGWALDSFHRYKEFRYALSVNVIGFVYSVGQAFDSGFHLATGKYALEHPYRYYFDFAVDQIVTYLLISASSSASTRIDDWQLNWGKDKFPDMATASVAISFLAFVAIAFSSLISGYTLCTSKLLQF